jgi:hypothetical protein
MARLHNFTSKSGVDAMTKNTRWLVAGAASVLIAGSGLAFGQSMQQQQPSTGASSGAQSGGAMQGGTSSEKSLNSTQSSQSGTSGQGSSSGTMQSQSGSSGQGSSSGSMQSQQQQKSGTSAQKGGTTGQGAASSGAGTSMNLSAQQKTQIKQVALKNSSIPHVNNVNVRINVGAVLPSTVELVDVPEDIVVIFPQFRRHKIVIIKNEIVIVEPSTLKIVAVLPA